MLCLVRKDLVLDTNDMSLEPVNKTKLKQALSLLAYNPIGYILYKVIIVQGNY